jgi:hypothetical protein
MAYGCDDTGSNWNNLYRIRNLNVAVRHVSYKITSVLHFITLKEKIDVEVSRGVILLESNRAI